MAAHKPYSVAPGDGSRQTILTRGALAGVVGMALLGLVLVFPKNDLLSRLRGETGKAGGDAQLTLTYLRNIVRTEKTDAGLRLLLAEKLIAARELPEAASSLALAKTLLGADEGLHARWQALDIALAAMRMQVARDKGDTAAMVRGQQDLRERLEAQVAQASSAAQVFGLLEQARALDATGTQRALLERLLQAPLLAKTSMADFSQAGREALAMGAFETSAQLYFAAKARTADSDAQQNLVLLGVKSLLASGKPLLAYEAAVREFGALPAGDARYWTLMDLAQGAGQPRQAALHAQQVAPASWDAPTLAAKLDKPQLLRLLDIALAGADLPRALTMGRAALRKTPGDTALNERVAQMAEWAGQPGPALAQWLALMQAGASQRAIDNVMRLSPMLYDDDALLAAWLARSRGRPLSEGETAQIVQIYERLGQPNEALRFLEQVTLTAPAQARFIASQKALLLDRAGRSAEAIAVLEKLREASTHLDRDDAMRLALLHLRRGDQAAALSALLAYTPPSISSAEATPAQWDAAYWDLRADLAYETGQQALSEHAWLLLLERSMGAVASPAGTKPFFIRDYQVERLLRHYGDQGNYGQAIALAQRVYPRMATDTIAIMWLDALQQQPSAAGLEAWVAALLPEHRARLLLQPEILARRAGVYAAIGQKALAADDYRAALRLRPHAPTQLSYWWLLIDMADAKTLRTELATAGAAGRAEPAFLEIQGAAWQFLGEPRRAVGFYRRQASVEKAGDYLWLANYSDVLEQAGDASLALRVRRHAFGLLGPAMARMDPARKKEAAQALLVRVRLSEAFASGVEKERLQRLLGQMLLNPADLPPELRRQADDLVVSWAVGGERNSVARQWLWRQQMQSVLGTRAATLDGKKPDTAAQDYAQLALALAEHDVQALDRLMEKSATQFAPIDRLTALRQLGRTAQAATLGTELALKEPEGPRNDELQQALEDDLRTLASRATLSVVNRRQDVLAQKGLRLQADVAITPRLRLTANLSDLRSSTQDPTILAAVPPRDRTLAVGARWLTNGGEASAALTTRQALANVAGLVLRLSQQLDARLSAQLEAQRNQPSYDSTPLALAGMQDKLAARLSYKLSNDIVLGGELSRTRYREQTGAYLGSARALSVNGTWYLRQGDPQWQVNTGWRKVLTRADGQPDAAVAFMVPGGVVPPAGFFVPPSASAFNLSLGWGLNQAPDALQGSAPPPDTAYSKAWRPWAEIGWERRTTQTTNGPESQNASLLRLGLRGSVTGRDQLVLGVEVRPSASGTTAREARVQYQWIGDR